MSRTNRYAVFLLSSSNAKSFDGALHLEREKAHGANRSLLLFAYLALKQFSHLFFFLKKQANFFFVGHSFLFCCRCFCFIVVVLNRWFYYKNCVITVNKKIGTFMGCLLLTPCCR